MKKVPPIGLKMPAVAHLLFHSPCGFCQWEWTIKVEHLSKSCAGISREFSPLLCTAGNGFNQNTLRDSSRSLGSWAYPAYRKQKIKGKSGSLSCRLWIEILSCFVFHYFQVWSEKKYFLFFLCTLFLHYRVLSMLCLLATWPWVLRKLKTMIILKSKRKNNVGWL